MWLHVGDFISVFILHFPSCVWCSFWVFPSHVCPSWAASQSGLTVDTVNKLQAWTAQLCSRFIADLFRNDFFLRHLTWGCFFQVSVCNLITYMSALVCTRINIACAQAFLGLISECWIHPWGQDPRPPPPPLQRLAVLLKWKGEGFLPLILPILFSWEVTAVA